MGYKPALRMIPGDKFVKIGQFVQLRSVSFVRLFHGSRDHFLKALTPELPAFGMVAHQRGDLINTDLG